MMLLGYEAVLSTEGCYKSFKLLRVDFSIALAGYAVEMMVMGFEGGCELVALLPSMIDGRSDAETRKKLNCSIDAYFVYYWKQAA